MSDVAIDGLNLPTRLLFLLSAGIWPPDTRRANEQNLRPLVPAVVLHRLAADEDTIFLLPPPFRTVAARVRAGDPFWTSPLACPDGINPDLAIEIGDFGLGSDAPILLDYSGDAARPSIIRLEYLGSGKTRWVPMAASFDHFADELGLDSIPPASC